MSQKITPCLWIDDRIEEAANYYAALFKGKVLNLAHYPDGRTLTAHVDMLGTTFMPVHQVLRLGRGAIIELDTSEDDAVSVLANNLPVAKGTVVVNGNRIAVNVNELLPRPPDMR